MLSDRLSHTRALPWLTALVVGVFLLVYVPRAGLGFIADDFGWVLDSRVRSAGDIARILTSDNGFYRPVITLTFSINEWWAGTDAGPYGVTNVLLALACAVAVACLGRTLGLTAGGAAAAASIWLLNPHAVNMAVLWLSGRTALLLTLFATLSAALLIRRRPIGAVAVFALALFSKEEAILLPPILAAWLLLGGEERRTLRTWLLASTGVVALYLAARASTSAMTPFNAPAYYRFTLEPVVLLRNIVEYLDRSATLAAGVALMGAAVLRRWPRLETVSRSRLAMCAVWIAGTLVIAVLLPVRSSLYALWPSVGASLAAAFLLQQSWMTASVTAQRRAVVGAAVLALAMAPLLAARAERWTSVAQLSAQALDGMARHLEDLPEGSSVVLHDDVSRRANLRAALGAHAAEAYLLRTGRMLNVWIEPPPPFTPDVLRPCGTCVARELRLDGGALVAVGR